MRGDKELKCLEIVRKGINSENCYALSLEEFEQIKTYVSEATPNTESNEFPDFVFSEGFIEHFQISSSKENRRGATHIKNKSMFSRDFDRNIEKFKISIANAPNKAMRIDSSFVFPDHSYDNLVSSLKYHWSNHFERLALMPFYKNKCGIFLIEYTDEALEMLEDIFRYTEQGLSLPIRVAQHFNDYKLSRDRELLRYIAQYKDEIQYVIYINSQEIEVMSTDKVEEIIKLLPWDFRIASFGYKMERRSCYGISIPEIKQEVSDDEQG